MMSDGGGALEVWSWRRRGSSTRQTRASLEADAAAAAALLVVTSTSTPRRPVGMGAGWALMAACPIRPAVDGSRPRACDQPAGSTACGVGDASKVSAADALLDAVPKSRRHRSTTTPPTPTHKKASTPSGTTAALPPKPRSACSQSSAQSAVATGGKRATRWSGKPSTSCVSSVSAPTSSATSRSNGDSDGAQRTAAMGVKLRSVCETASIETVSSVPPGVAAAMQAADEWKWMTADMEVPRVYTRPGATCTRWRKNEGQEDCRQVFVQNLLWCSDWLSCRARRRAHAR